MKRVLLWIVGSILFLLMGCFVVVPGIVERAQNHLQEDTSVTVKESTQKIHEQLFIVDLHADSLLWKRNLLKKSSRGHVDIPRLQEGNVAIQAFTVVTKSPRNQNIDSNLADSDNITPLAIAELWPMGSWFNLYQRALFQAHRLDKFAAKSNGEFRVIHSKAELQKYILDRRANPHLTAGFLGLEGAHAIEENIDTQFQGLYEAGYRMMAATHFFDNRLAGSLHGMGRKGLSHMGEKFVKLCNEHNVIIDVAHISENAIRDTLALSTKPVLISHTGFRGVCNNNRNMSDELAKAIADKGGIIGVGFWNVATCGENIEAIANSILYGIHLVGEDHIALGSDNDGAVTAPMHIGQLARLTQKLLDKGMSETTLRKVMGENTLRFLSENLPD
jgi:membrane dipeptidase